METNLEHSTLGEGLAYYLGLTPVAALAVVITTVVMYFVFILMSRILGQRMLARMSAYDMLLVIALGAIIGRTMIGWVPTLGSGLIVLATLVILEVTVGSLVKYRVFARLFNNPPVLLMAGADFVDLELRRCHVTPSDLRSQLRKAGVRNRSEVAAVILEPTGELSILRRGVPIAREMIAGVRSGREIPAEFLEPAD